MSEVKAFGLLQNPHAQYNILCCLSVKVVIIASVSHPRFRKLLVNRRYARQEALVVRDDGYEGDGLKDGI